MSPDQELIKTIGRKILLLRKSYHISREELAFRIGVCPQQLFKYEMGLNRITADRLLKIIEVLDIYETAPCLLCDSKRKALKTANWEDDLEEKFEDNPQDNIQYSPAELIAKIRKLVTIQ
jgi:transcriptional regulator with XRE-family HTH domain